MHSLQEKRGWLLGGHPGGMGLQGGADPGLSAKPTRLTAVPPLRACVSFLGLLQQIATNLETEQQKCVLSQF